MKYRDLVRFDPIRSIVVLKDSADRDKARQLIESYVISERMADVIEDIIFEHLQFVRPVENKGIMVVGNYGTGKSHLMSVIAAIAENEGTSQYVRHPRIAEKAKEIEGKFKVLRMEFDGITLPLRQVIFHELSRYLQSIGVAYEMPDLDHLLSNKDELTRMMNAFHEVYPDHGLLLVIDELLDYLRSRREQEMMLDLNFLRAMGEICQSTRFRFITGVQEMLFDNPKFHFVAEPLYRVRERTVQAVIVREDLEFVISRRLLNKDERQKALIREHLQRFVPLYDKLGEQLEKFVELFPIHPSYLATFENVKVVEKRVALTTISDEIEKLLDLDVPETNPGIISYDSYWDYIVNDRALRSNQDIREVANIASVLFDRIENAFPKRQYKPMAKRIVAALAVFRLTTNDIRVKMGITATELRDQLLLHIDLDDIDTDFLNATIDTVLKEILKAVSYQYISYNPENGQYYIDVDKVQPIDDYIAQKAEMLSGNQLDRYYFEVLEQVLECSPYTYISGYRIWETELEWYAHKVTRRGYLFFGAPNERSTAQPERDFYIYMLQPFDPPKFKDEEKPDEVFFKLDTQDEEFHQSLRLFAGAREMALTAPSSTKHLYEAKAHEYLQKVNRWLRTNMVHAYKITYKGKTKKLAEWSFSAPAMSSVREIVMTAADECLTNWFEEKYPDYPVFPNDRTCITQQAMVQTYIPETLAQIPNPKTKTAQVILKGLVMLEGERVNPHKSGYARWVLEELNKKGDGKVVNANELLEVVQVCREEEVRRTKEYQLEPELFSVVLAALVYNGDIEITVNGETYDAMKYDRLVRLQAKGILEFSYIKKSRSTIPQAELRALFEMLDINPSLLHPNAQEQGVAQLRIKVEEALRLVVPLMNAMKDGIPTWEAPLLSEEEIKAAQQRLQRLNQFLQSLQIYKTPAHLKNFKYGLEEIAEQKSLWQEAKNFHRLRARASEVSQKASYFVHAVNHLPTNDPWVARVEKALEDLYHALKAGENCVQESAVLDQLKKEYIDKYYQLHSQVRLGATQENQKQQMLRDGRLEALQHLAKIKILPVQRLKDWRGKLDQLKVCWKLNKADLEHTPLCSHCKYRPKEEAYTQTVSLTQLDMELTDLLAEWTDTLLATLNDPEFRESISLLAPQQQDLLRQFQRQGKFAFPIDLRLIETLQELMEGIHKVELPLQKLVEMAGDGNPLTVEELRERFERLLREEIGTQPAKRVRIMLKKE
ncbi:DUF6079 family protein [Bacillaceae bacterium]